MFVVHKRTNRKAFTLLEVLLASLIALLLLAALYAAFDVVIRQTDVGRTEIERNDLSRAVINRMSIDVIGACGVLPPKSGGLSEAATAAAAATGQTEATEAETASDPTSTAGTAAASETAAATSASGSDATTTDTGTVGTVTAATTGGYIPFSAGLVGNSQVMTLFVSRVPTGLINKELLESGQQQPTGIRKITYYRGTAGLCRQERPWVTADGVWNNADADRSDEQGDLLAEEITDAQFQYFDGTSWVDSWDGTQLNGDGKTLLGPPRAIKVFLTVERNGTEPKRFSHTFVLRSANGLTPILPSTTEEETSTTGGSP